MKTFKELLQEKVREYFIKVDENSIDDFKKMLEKEKIPYKNNRDLFLFDMLDMFLDAKKIAEDNNIKTKDISKGY